MEEVKLGKYKHFKGGEYEVLGVARHSETLEELVVYRALYHSEEFGKNALWERLKEDFISSKEIDEKEIIRFEYIGK